MAPEVIKGTQLSTGWMKADVWSLGCTVVEMLTGALPFSEYENPMTAMYQIASGKSPPISSNVNVSNMVHSFIAACCAVDPTQRLAVEELLLHPFVNQSYSDDHTLIVIPDGEDCVDPDLPSINEDAKESPSSQMQSPTKQDIEQKKLTPGEQTFRSRIPVLQSRGMKLHVDSPDIQKKPLEEQDTPSLFKSRKIREPVPPHNFSPNTFQPSILTPTPPTSEKGNSSAKFRKQTSRGLSNPLSESDSNKSATPKNILESPIHHFSDTELSPVNQENMNTPSSLIRESSVPKLLSVETLKQEVYEEQIDVPSNNRSLMAQEITDSQIPKESLKLASSDESILDPKDPTHDSINTLSLLNEHSQDIISTQQNPMKSPLQSVASPSSTKTERKKELRFDTLTTLSREKSDILEESDDNIPALLINGSLMNSKGSIVEVLYSHYVVVIILGQFYNRSTTCCSSVK